MPPRIRITTCGTGIFGISAEIIGARAATEATTKSSNEVVEDVHLLCLAESAAGWGAS